ncbi:MAG TPA: hypothetical protein VFF11_00970, partial [Candidatus Binatia bacterium]|nr:hypothetical protein [Candidatus Binatia bacterium]
IKRNARPGNPACHLRAACPHAAIRARVFGAFQPDAGTGKTGPGMETLKRPGQALESDFP